MRIKLFLLAFAAALAMNVPAHASAVLGFAQGNANGTAPSGNAVAAYDPNTPQSDPGNQGASSASDPAASVGVNDFTPGTLLLGTTNNAGVIGTSAANPWVLQANTKYVLQIQMVDYENTGGGFTFNAAANQKLAQWGVRLTWNNSPGVASIARETPDINGNVTTAMNVGAVNGATGGNSTTVAPGGLTSVLNSYNNTWTFQDDSSNPTPNSVALGEQTPGTGTGYTLPSLVGTTPNRIRRYILANVILTTSGAGGDTRIDMVDSRPLSNDFQTFGPPVTNVDSVVFATTPQLFIHVNAVPEPSSMALAGLAIGGLVVRLRRKKNAIVA